jgi:hypothetical protein
MIKLAVKVLKYLGLYPAAAGGLSHLIDIDFLTKADLLKGFLGITPHLLAIALYWVCWQWAKRSLASLPTAVANKRRIAWSLAALILIGLCVILSFTPLSESFLPGDTGVYRWYVVFAVYLAFYLCLGASMG